MGSAIEPNRGFRRASRSSRGSDMECIEPRLNAKLRLVIKYTPMEDPKRIDSSKTRVESV